MSEFNRDEFDAAVAEYQFDHPRQRYGQAVFNVAYRLYPERVDAVRGVFGVDPFYVDEFVPAFIAALTARGSKEAARG